MAKTVDHISSGRLILGIGAGWFEREYREYGYTFGSARERLRALGEALPQIKRRWQVELPRPVRNPIPILIGGEGEQVLLKLVAGHADIWNGFGPAQRYRHKCEVLDRRCAEVGRDPAEIERSVMTALGTTTAHTARTLDPLVEAGASHIIMNLRAPWKFGAVEKLVRWRDSRR
jgi:alkanesulfonate monooxygenase SsuD/methylene tetrahydromethanopterin reductase-like flavin-dependent oxidoreductase (luciferase family)